MQKSVSNKIWKQKEINEYYVQQLAGKLNISDLLARILSSRALHLEDAECFLSPKLKNLLPDPFHLLDMEQAVSRTIQAIFNKEKICIFADYDVDGATSSALLRNVFRDLGHNAEIYVPDRITEGYGPTIFAMEKIKGNATLLITVDCGSMAHEALEHAKNIGLETIVIDHHLSADILPSAIAVVNPNRLDETSGFGYLSAAGVSFLFVVALVSRLKSQGFFAIKNPPNLMEYLDLVALGTVCDVMPLTRLNRAFVVQGLKVLAQRRNIGLTALCDLGGIDEKPNCYHLGFVLGPRINAGGRVGKASLGASLLSTTDVVWARELAEELEKHNNERKVIEIAITEEAMEIARMQHADAMLFVTGEGWHAGVIGIIAGRLKETFNKPVVVIALNDDIGKASCRSIRGIDLGSLILEAKNQGLLIAGGGHAMAAGFTAEKGQLDKLHQFLKGQLKGSLAKLTDYNIEEYNLELTTHGAGLNILEELQRLEPYGHGNPEPIFKISGLFVLKADMIKNKHIKCLLAPAKDAYGSRAISAIAFNSVGTEIEKILLSPKAHKFSAIGALKINNWQNQQRLQLHIRDLIMY